MDQIVLQMQKYMEDAGVSLLFAAKGENVFYLSDLDVLPCCCNPVLYAVQPLSPTVVLIPKTGKRIIFTASALKQYIDDRNLSADVYYYPSALFLRFDEGVSTPEIYAPSLEECVTRYLSDHSVCIDQIVGDEAFDLLAERWGILDGMFPAENILLQCRARKVPEEIARLRIASRVSYDAMELVRQRLEEGGECTEENLFFAMRDLIYSRRCQWNYTSLSAGRYSPDIYHQPINYKLQKNDAVRMDVGAVWKGYGSDVARTYFYGGAKSADERLYAVLCEAQHRMVEAAHPGQDLAELYHIGHNYIQQHGYPEYRRAGLGHSVGVVTEEQPFISPVNAGVVMEENMVFSIETPYYIKDRAGFNVEDIVLITKNGHEILK